MQKFIFITITIFFLSVNTKATYTKKWNSKWVYKGADNLLKYKLTDKGDKIPDFGQVGYHKGKIPPNIPVVLTIQPKKTGDDFLRIQTAINKVARMKLNKQGFRGTILFKKGEYRVARTLTINTSGIVLRGEGDSETGTIFIATKARRSPLIVIACKSRRRIIFNSTQKIIDDYVPVGSKSITIKDSSNYKVGDKITVIRPGTKKWISDLKMDQIPNRPDGGKSIQWSFKRYTTYFDRVITKIISNTINIDQPIVMAIDSKYGGGFIQKYNFPNLTNHCGIENILMKSMYTSDTDEQHSWNAIIIKAATNSWVRNVTAKYFAYSCVTTSHNASYISILNCQCLDAKSIITGSRRYSFCISGQMNLVANCHCRHGRHDYVTAVRVAGPNVFTNCTAEKTHNDIGPHQRWAMGILYDNIKTTGIINVQDRGDWGSGHGWAGVNHVLWNCKARHICVQNPWVSGQNYCIACKCRKANGKMRNRPDGIWEGQNQKHLAIPSLYQAQKLDAILRNRENKNKLKIKLGKCLYAEKFKTKKLTNWFIELEKPKTSSIKTKNNKLDINTSAGATIWFKPKLPANILISYTATSINNGGTNDRVSDINQFWMAKAPNEKNIFKGNGNIKSYNNFQLYYACIGSNNNKTTIFQHYKKNKQHPIYEQFTDKPHLLKPNTKYKIRIICYNGNIQFFVNKKRFFKYKDKHPLKSGRFAFRTVFSHLQIENFKIYQLIKK